MDHVQIERIRGAFRDPEQVGSQFLGVEGERVLLDYVEVDGRCCYLTETPVTSEVMRLAATLDPDAFHWENHGRSFDVIEVDGRLCYVLGAAS